MKSKTLHWIILGVATMCISACGKREPAPVVSLEEERAAADALLVAKLSGPRYFSATADAVPEDGGPWIRVHEARSQMPRVIAERKLDPEGARAVELLIDEMTEHHPSRVLGGTRINLPRLNLSLDSIK